MKHLSLLFVAVALFLGSCERHSWEDQDTNGDGIIQESEKGTVRLYEGHGHDKDGGKHPEGAGDHGKEKLERH